jgi:hypothetical protein
VSNHPHHVQASLHRWLPLRGWWRLSLPSPIMQWCFLFSSGGWLLSSMACVKSAWMNNRASVCCWVPPHPSASKQTAVLLYCRWDGFIEPLKTGNCYPNLKCSWGLYPRSSRAEVQASTSASGYVLAREQELLFILSIMLVNVTSWRVLIGRSSDIVLSTRDRLQQ